jgi:hypothetical protein
VLRFCSMILLMLTLCTISVGGKAMSPWLVKLAAFLLVCEICLKNTILRILP